VISLRGNRAPPSRAPTDTSSLGDGPQEEKRRLDRRSVGRYLARETSGGSAGPRERPADHRGRGHRQRSEARRDRPDRRDRPLPLYGDPAGHQAAGPRAGDHRPAGLGAEDPRGGRRPVAHRALRAHERAELHHHRDRGPHGAGRPGGAGAQPERPSRGADPRHREGAEVGQGAARARRRGVHGGAQVAAHRGPRGAAWASWASGCAK
jgi:hypothetical protein